MFPTEHVMKSWRAKLKHFLILSSAGKPIYSRHGDDQLVTNYIGLVQTIISFYQSTNDTLRGFTAGDVRFVVMSKGPLNLVAITRLPESDSQLRTQLEALYMQILSTLTLPSMERMFAARANYDLRRPLQGTETLLSALADGFTRGSPSTLLSALECLKLPKSLRATINNTLLKTRSENLLYGLIVASGKLVSVVRPKKHSLHPGDLQLIFNMLFEAGSVKAGGGENWIPLCLPGFNNTGYLYMYVSFLNLDHPTEQMEERPQSRSGADDEVAVLLISAEKESFFEMRGMRDDLVQVCISSRCIRLHDQVVPSPRHLDVACLPCPTESAAERLHCRHPYRCQAGPSKMHRHCARQPASTFPVQIPGKCAVHDAELRPVLWWSFGAPAIARPVQPPARQPARQTHITQSAPRDQCVVDCTRVEYALV
jgi:hypothetical protein